MKKVLLFLLILTTSVKMVSAAEISFENLIDRMKEEKDYVTTECLTSNLKSNNNEIYITYNSKEGCTNYFTKDWQTKFVYNENILNFEYKNIKDAYPENANTKIFNDLKEILSIEIQWADKITEIINNEHKERNYLDMGIRLSYIIAEDGDTVQTKVDSINKVLYCYNIFLKEQKLFVKNITSNSFELKYNDLNLCSQNLINEKKIYMVNENTKEYEIIDDLNYNQYKKTYNIENLTPDTTYNIILLDGVFLGDITTLPPTLSIKTLSDNKDDNKDNNEENNKDDKKEEKNENKETNKETNKEIIPENPKTGEVISISLIVLGIISAIIIQKKSKKNNKINKI